jgi:Predicted Fe-S protein
MASSDSKESADSVAAQGGDGLQPDSPCLGYCTTALGDDVCKSCGRTFVEVTHWITMTPEEKAAVWSRLNQDGFLEKQRIRLQKTDREETLC